MYPESVAEKFRDPALFCSSVLILLIDTFGTEVIEWEPESIYAELEDRFKLHITRQLADKINAATALLSSNLYHKSLEAFTTINTAFNFKTVDNREFNFCTLEDVMWGATEARLLEGPDAFDKEGFTHEIGGYTGELLSVEGITKPPTILRFAEFDPAELDQRDLALAGDVVTAEAYWSRQEEENKKLEDLAARNMDALIKEVSTLPLKNGKASIPESFRKN